MKNSEEELMVQMLQMHGLQRYKIKENPLYIALLGIISLLNPWLENYN
jgi:hypothetical protein